MTIQSVFLLPQWGENKIQVRRGFLWARCTDSRIFSLADASLLCTAPRSESSRNDYGVGAPETRLHFSEAQPMTLPSHVILVTGAERLALGRD